MIHINNWNVLSSNLKIKELNESIISYILKLRNVYQPDMFLNPPKRCLFDSDAFVNIGEAKDIVVNGINNNKSFCVYFDVDCDGICAGTIMYKYLLNYTNNVTYLINQGKAHGLSHIDINNTIKDVDILIIVDSLDDDCVYEKIKDKGIEVIVLDHHDTSIDRYYATLVSSSYRYCNPHLSGSGVTWKFCAYLDEQLQNNYADDLIDLCAIGIIADVCDVSENSLENRYLCYKGLNNLQNKAVKAMLGGYPFDSQSIIWSIAPLINASQRTFNNLLTLLMFISDDESEIRKKLICLKEIKIQQDIEVEQICEQIENNLNNSYNFLFGFTQKAEYSGLIASKFADRYNKPTIIFYKPCDSSDEVRGSIRGGSVENFKSLVNATNLAVAKGHEVAAGIYVKAKSFNKFIRALNKSLENYKCKNNKFIDLELKIEDVTEDLICDILRINEVHGKGFSPVSIVIYDVEINNPVLLKEKHTKFTYSDIDFIIWNNTDLFIIANEEEEGYFKTIDVVGELQLNYFAGKVVQQFIIKDYKNICILPTFLTKSNL